jgi:YidC/Oxa1 family membrane protein insertase
LPDIPKGAITRRRAPSRHRYKTRSEERILLADYQNPQHEPGGEKRLLLIFLVTFVAMLAFQPLLKKYLPTPPPPQQQRSQPTGTAPGPAAQSAAMAAQPVVPVSGATTQASSETETVLENDLYRITFTNRGAQVKSWILKKFDNDAESGPLDLVNSAAAAPYGYPLSLWTYDESLRNKLNSVLYVTSQAGKLSTPATITFEYADQDLAVRKTFTFDNTYIVKVETSTSYKGSAVPALPAWPSGFGDQTTPPQPSITSSTRTSSGMRLRK